MEIALCLAIVGFALVAIIGVLPTGMRVQKDNREETIIGQDGLYLLEAIRSGARGLDDLTNYVEVITISNVVYRPNLAVAGRGRLTYNSDLKTPLAQRLTNGAQIVSYLTTPKLQTLPNGNFVSNTVTAQVRSITGVAAEKSVRNSSVKDFAFRYQVRAEVLPFVVNTNVPPPSVGQADERLRRRDLTNNLYDLRLTLNWPLFQRGDRWEVGYNRKTFRTLVSGRIGREDQYTVFEPSNYTVRR